jgi:predicted restriction endonuclease
MHSGNPDIIKCAELIGRTPSALSMKLTNFASLDPAITSSGRKGLQNVSVADKVLWEEMQADWDQFAVAAEGAASALGVVEQEGDVLDEADANSLVDYSGGTRPTQVMVRVGQYSFRRSVLSAYNYRCCITGLAVPALLVASHIKPWSVDPANRLNPRNGLCLSALHDRSFDAGIITIAKDMTVRVAKSYSRSADGFFESALSAYDGRPIAMPERFEPDEDLLEYHRQTVFLG